MADGPIDDYFLRTADLVNWLARAIDGTTAQCAARDAGHARRRVPDPVISCLLPTRQKVISLWTAVVASVIFSTTGCGLSENPYEKTNPADTRKAVTRLAELPTLEDTETQLHAAVVELGSYVSSLVPSLTWQWVDERSVESCDRPYDQTQGSKVRLQNYVSSPGIPDKVWPQVLDRARQLAAPLGVTGSEVFANKPGNHTVRLYSQEGTTIFVGTQGAVISSNTGCRLPQHDRFRADPRRVDARSDASGRWDHSDAAAKDLLREINKADGEPIRSIRPQKINRPFRFSI